MSPYREEIISQLKVLFRSNKIILAAWEGGSAATGYLDEYSDLDLGVICEDDKVELVFQELEQFLIDYYGIKHIYRMPEPSWHGHAQCFYILEKTIPYFYIDILIEKVSSNNRFTESDRHGKSVIWFDKKNLIDPTPTSDEEVVNRCKSMFKNVRDSFPILVLDVNKQIKRGNQIDAFDLYFRLLNRLGVLLNIKYRPHKYDFGLRYTNREFPENVVQFLRSITFPEKYTNLLNYTEKIETEFYRLIDELKENWG